MLSVEVDRISSSSVWEETSFCWNRKTVNELIIILLNTSTFSYWTRTYHAWKSLTIPGRQSLFLFRLGRDFFLLEQKDSKWIDRYSSLKTSKFSYWTRTCQVSKSLTIPLRCCRQRTTEFVPLPFGRRPLSGWTKRQ